MPSKTPVTPPEPRHVNRPLVKQQGYTVSKPLTAEAMQCIAGIVEQSGISRTDLGQAIGRKQQEISEWLVGYRYAPGAEPMLELLKWAFKKDRKAVIDFLSAKPVAAAASEN